MFSITFKVLLEGFLDCMDILYIGMMSICRSKLTINKRYFCKQNRKGLGNPIYFNSKWGISLIQKGNRKIKKKQETRRNNRK